MIYTLTFDDLPTGSAADVFKTLAALIAADTAGHRARLLALAGGPSDDTPPDRNVAFRIERIADVSAGSAGTPGTSVTGANMGKVDPGSMDSIITGARGYTVDPTTFETEPLFRFDMNSRGGFRFEWAPEMAYTITRDQLLALRAAPRAASAVRLSGTMEFEVY